MMATGNSVFTERKIKIYDNFIEIGTSKTERN